MSADKNQKQSDYERGQKAGSQAGFYEKTLHSYERPFQSDAYNAGFKNGVANQPQSTIFDTPIATQEEPKRTSQPKEESTQSGSGGSSNWDYSSSNESGGGLKIFFVCVGVVIAIILGWRLFQDVAQKQSESHPQEKTVFVPRPPDVFENKIVFHTQWGDVETKNFLNDPDVITNDAGIRIANTPQYTIFYSRDFGYITIALFGETISEIKKSQQVAEEKLLEKLGGNKQEICKIDIAITWPPELIAKNKSNSFPLSFCPGN